MEKKKNIQWRKKIVKLREAVEPFLYQEDSPAAFQIAKGVAQTCDYLLGEEKTPISTIQNQLKR